MGAEQTRSIFDLLGLMAKLRKKTSGLRLPYGDNHIS